MKNKQIKVRGGVNDPQMKRKMLFDISNEDMQALAYKIAGKLAGEDKVFVKNILQIKIKKSERRQRFDLKEQIWKDVPEKLIVSFLIHKKFKDLILQEYSKHLVDRG